MVAPIATVINFGGLKKHHASTGCYPTKLIKFCVSGFKQRSQTVLNRKLTCVTFFVLSVTITSGISLAGDSWWPSLFATKKKDSVSAKSETTDKAVPEFRLPDPNAAENRWQEKPSAFAKMKTTTKVWWHKTLEVLSPYPPDPNSKKDMSISPGDWGKQPSIKY
jgi:hypothetical protein